MTISPINLYSIIILFLVLIIGIAAYVVEGLALFRMGKKAGISWAWVAWIPGAENFVVARMAKWKAWALFPTLTLVWAIISIFVGMALMGIAAFVNVHQTFTLIPVGQLPSVAPMHPVTITSMNSEPTTVMPGVLPVIGTVVFFVILLRIALRKEVQYHESGMRTVFGSLIRDRV